MPKKNFEDLFLPNYRKRRYRKINKVIGLDTETVDGKCILIADSDGDYRITKSFDDCIKFLVRKKYRHSLNFFFNLKFDSQAIIKHLPLEKISELWIYKEIKYKNYRIYYLPTKHLRINRGNEKYTENQFFDLAILYRPYSLDAAAQKCLGEQKMSNDIIETFKRLHNTEKYFKKHKDVLIKYCIRDAVLCKKLGEYLQEKLNQVGCKIYEPYSPASISKQYITDQNIKTYDYKFYLKNKTIIKYAFDSYYGGRFECFVRGNVGYAHQYDIHSSYPYVISQLHATSNYNVNWQIEDDVPKNINDVAYCFIKCDIYIPNIYYIAPLPEREDYLYEFKIDKYKMFKNMPRVFYPNGYFYDKIITLPEYLLIKKYWKKAIVDIKKCVVGYKYHEKYPFKNLILKLYRMKESSRDNAGLYLCTKIILNGIYGSFWEMKEKILYDIPKSVFVNGEIDNFKLVRDPITRELKLIYKQLTAGRYWNPIYASYITAKARCNLIEPLLKHKIKPYLFATDGIIIPEKLPSKYVRDELGAWSYEGSGQTYILGSGIYYIISKDGKTIKYRVRGFKKKQTNIRKLIEENPSSDKIIIVNKRPLSIGECLKIYEWRNKINNFVDISKELDINFDEKREWERNFKNCKDFLENKIDSWPRWIPSK